MWRWLMRLVMAAALLLALGLWATRPRGISAEDLTGIIADAGNGERVFHAGGCASCHAAPGAEGAQRTVLSGGRSFPSPFGTFYAPNISPDPDRGIGAWRPADLVNAMQYGTSPEGRHYYPAFPYASYRLADPEDIVDLFAFLMTLPPSQAENRPHEIGFPFNIRATLGVWKLLFLNDGPVVELPDRPELARGRYLAEALGHCGECHTPRNLLGAMKRGQWLAGAPNPAGRGTIPDITPGALRWSAGEIVEYLTSGFTPEFDTAGGHMAEMIENLSQLPRADRQAIAAYLKALPAR